MILNIPIKKVTVLLSQGTDLITIIVDDNNEAFPNMKYNTTIKIETEYNKGEEYCQNILGLDYEVINVR